MSASPFETVREHEGAEDHAPRASWLFLLLEAERPLARGARYALRGVDEIVIGRGARREAFRTNGGRVLEVRVPSPWMSSRHARLRRAQGGGWWLEDSGSRNGTLVNGARVGESAVGEDDVVEAGRAFFVVRDGFGDDGADEDGETLREPFGVRTLLLPLRERIATLLRVAEASASPILLLGPTGSGKELLARAIHERSRRSGPFVAVNCGALPTTLVESLLFGHVRGAFSGAVRDETGLVRSADGGTLFLDEIGDLPASSQSALLRVLQEGEVVPVGATRAVPVDIRVIAATHRPIESLAESGAFRADLLARLRGFTHRLPSLAARREDLGLILGDVLERVAGERAAGVRLGIEAARALASHRWPLNVRELHQCIVTSVALAADGVIEARHLPEAIASARFGAVPEVTEVAEVRPLAPRDVRLRATLAQLLAEHRGNVAAVARALSKAPAQIHRWMKRLKIDPTEFRV